MQGTSSPEIPLEALSPRGEIPPSPVRGLSPRVSDLAGKTIGLFDNGKEGAEEFLIAIRELLSAKFPTATFLHLRKLSVLHPDEALYNTAAQKCDAFVFAMGD